MKILYIIDQTNLFGSELHVFDLIRKLAPSNQIKLLAFKDGPLIELINGLGIDVCIIKVDWLSGIFKAGKVMNLIKGFSPDIIHSHQPKAIFFGSIVSKMAGKKHIATIHSIPNGFAVAHKGFKKHIVLIFHIFAQYCAEAFSVKSIFLTRYNKIRYSFFKKKAVVIYNWVSDRLPSNQGIPETENQRHDPHVIKFLSIGSIDENKGFKELLEIFNSIRESIKYELLIVGSGDKKTEDYLKNYIIDHNMQSEVKLLGYQSNLAPVYNNAHYFILLPKEEAFGLVFIEAMHFGLAIICSDMPQLREIIPAENIFIKNQNSIDRETLDKISNRRYREIVGPINRSVSKKLFSIEEQIKLVSELYVSVITNK